VSVGLEQNGILFYRHGTLNCTVKYSWCNINYIWYGAICYFNAFWKCIK